MNPLVYTRYELLRTLRNRRFFILSLGFPLVLYFVIASPQPPRARLRRDAASRLPLYYMVGLAAFGTMSAMLSSGARIAAERAVGWNRQLRITPAVDAHVLPREGPDRLHDGAAQPARAVPRRAPRSASACRRATGWR